MSSSELYLIVIVCVLISNTLLYINLTKMISKIDSKLDKVFDDNKLVKDTLLSSQRNDLLEVCEKCLRSGYASLESQQTIAEMYNTYHNLGGDSWMTDLVHKVVNLPLEEKKKRVLHEDK